MRQTVSAQKIRQLLRGLGRRCRGPGRIYLVGGASALLEGWRDSTIDVDLKIDPEPIGVFEAIAELKNELDVNIELASPDQFLPEIPDWRDRSTYIERQGSVDFFHYDFRAQALAKLARGHDRDLSDVRQMIERGLVDGQELALVFAAIEPALIRFPGLDVERFSHRVREQSRRQK